MVSSSQLHYPRTIRHTDYTRQHNYLLLNIQQPLGPRSLTRPHTNNITRHLPFPNPKLERSSIYHISANPQGPTTLALNTHPPLSADRKAMCQYYAHAFTCKHVSLSFARFCPSASMIQTRCGERQIWQTIRMAESCEECKSGGSNWIEEGSAVGGASVGNVMNTTRTGCRK